MIIFAHHSDASRALLDSATEGESRKLWLLLNNENMEVGNEGDENALELS